MATTKRTQRVGAYAKLLANYAADDALIEAGEAAELLFCRGLAFCATSDSDGFITDAQVVRYVGAGMKDAMKRAHRLAACGPWVRVEGGFIVRSWTKIHETAEEKGRRLAADRERKKKPPESETPSEQIPDGIRVEGTQESLSLIHDSAQHDTARHDTTAEEPQVLGERPETLQAAPATEPSKAEGHCTSHPNGNTTGEPCLGCKRVNDRKAKDAAKEAARAARDAEERLRNCPDCNGSGWVENDDGKPIRKCSSHLSVSVLDTPQTKNVQR